jgi:phage shock protein E
MDFCAGVVKDIPVMNSILKNKIILIGIVLGAVAGYFYYRFYGCTGSCTITSSPRNSALYGALMGGLLFSMFKKEKPNSQKTKIHE